MDKETETVINRLMSDLKAAQDLSDYLAAKNKQLRDEIFNLKTEVHFDDQTIKSLQVINERLQRDVEEANARAYVMAKEVTLWQSRAAQKEGE